MRTIEISESIKQEIAQKVVGQSHPGYSSDYMGSWYVVGGTSVVHAQRNQPWNPWSEDSDVISVDALVALGGMESGGFGCYRTEIEWALSYADAYAEWTAAYVAAGSPEGPEESLAEYQIVGWAEEHGFAARVDEIETEQFELAVDFALGYVPDSYDAEAYEERYA